MEPHDNLEPLKYESQPKTSNEPIPSTVLPEKSKGLTVSAMTFVGAAVIFLLVAFGVMIIVAGWPPADFPSGQVISIAPGSSLGSVTEMLYEKHLINSIPLFKILAVSLSGERGIKAGDYLFEGKMWAPEVAWRLINGEQGLPPIKITIPEGFTVAQISDTLGKNIPGFSTSTFLINASPNEGYLFPETYFFTRATTPADALQKMKKLFNQKIASESEAINTSGRATSTIIIMASILEREATSSSDRRVIAGILWKRLDAKEPLGVDAALSYELGKSGTKLTSADLEKDTPYNTYKHLGLPPTPISNPGLSAIEDALNPTTSNYWYYLSDSKGNIHFAKDYAGQLANEAKYL